MTKYLEQTAWLLNPEPDGRKRGRQAKQSWPAGTRWVFEETQGILTGDGMRISGTLADKVIANCKEVEPGFGAIVDDLNYKEIFGRLIDQGKITVADLQASLKNESQEDDSQEDGDNEADLESSELPLRPLLEHEEYRYRHWLTLDPPSEEFIRNVAEQDRRNAILDEYAQRTQQANPDQE